MLGRLQGYADTLDSIVEVPWPCSRESTYAEAQARGKYLAMTMCTECHGQDLRGGPTTPSLMMAAAYSEDDFHRLLGTGVPLGGRKLQLMSDVARSRFSHLTGGELSPLYAFLQRWIKEPPPATPKR